MLKTNYFFSVKISDNLKKEKKKDLGSPKQSNGALHSVNPVGTNTFEILLKISSKEAAKVLKNY